MVLCSAERLGAAAAEEGTGALHRFSPDNPRLLSAMVASRPAAGNPRVTRRSSGEPTNSREASAGMVEAAGCAVPRNPVVMEMAYCSQPENPDNP